MAQQGSISSNDLMKKLVQAKKVMNKVDGGNYERGHVNSEMLRSDPSELMEMQTPQQPNTRPVGGNMSIDKIHLRIMDGSIPNEIKLETIVDRYTCQQIH